MTEERVTKAILQWLLDSGWDIVCFDFPQSGTGKVLHPNNTTSKTEGAIIPDIIAYKNGIVVDFENKDRFVMADFEKINFLKNTNNYNQSLANLLKDVPYNTVYYGVGMPYSENNLSKAEINSNIVDFILFVKDDGSIITIDKGGIFK